MCYSSTKFEGIEKTATICATTCVSRIFPECQSRAKRERTVAKSYSVSFCQKLRVQIMRPPRERIKISGEMRVID